MVERPAETTYMAECFWPDVREAEVQDGAERVRRSAAQLTREGRPVTFTGSILVPGDEVVFYLFDSDSVEVVREACERAQIPFERLVESVREAATPSAGGEA